MTVDPDIAGLTTKGNAALPNGSDGLLIDGTAHGNVIGGYAALGHPAEHVLRAMPATGWRSPAGPTGNQVFNSYIGTNVLGTAGAGQPGRAASCSAGTPHGNAIGDHPAAARPT